MKNVVIILCLVLFSNLYGQKTKPSPSEWNGNGKAELNLPKENYKYFNKAKLYYHVSNDNENIYLDMRIEDSEIQNKILKQGLMVWINVDNRQIMKYGVRFPIGTQVSGRPGVQGGPAGGTGFSTASPISQATRIELTGFSKEERMIIPSINEDNFSGTVHYDNDGVLIYKMIMPVSRIETNRNLKSEPIALGIEPAPVSQIRQGPANAAAQPQEIPSGSLAKGGGGGRSGGGAGRPAGGGFSGGAPAAQPGSTSVILWIKNITLVAEK